MNGKHTDRTNKILKNTLQYGVTAIGGMIFLYLTYYCFRYTYYFIAEYAELFYIEKDSAVLHLLVLAAVFAVIAGISCALKREKQSSVEKKLSIILYVVMGFSFVISLWWVLTVPAVPVADQQYIVDSAIRLIQQDYDVFLPGEYLGQVPYQLGITVLFKTLFTVFHTESILVVEVMNCLCIPVIVFAGYHILKLLTRKPTACAVYLIFMLFCFPAFFYTPFIYGELISLTAGMLLLWLTLCYLQGGQRVLLIPMTLLSIVGVETRGNFWIVIVACSIFLFLYGIRGKNIWCFLCILLIILTPVLTGKAMTAYYEQKSGIAIDQGIPAICNVAMGIHDEGTQPHGWNNLYNYYTYSYCENNAEKSAQFSKDYIKIRLEDFADGTADWKEFFSEKILTQWEEPTYQSLLANHNFDRKPSAFVQNVYYGDLRTVFEHFMNQYQWLLYLGVLLGLFWCCRRRKAFYTMLIPVVLIGGFLFSILWEAKTRYIFPYFIYMIGFAVYGLTETALWIQEMIITRAKHSRENT